MIVTHKWLKDYLNFELSPEETAQKLTMLGLEVDSVEKVGEDYAIEIDLTCNKADSLSVFGVARELSLLAGGETVFPDSDPGKKPSSDHKPRIQIKDPELCRRYAGVIIENIKVTDSPDWMKTRLEALGIRPVNSIVDITNYVLMELGHPLHAFDLNLLKGKQIIVRRADPGEKITTLDDSERELRDDMLVISDAEQAVAVAGVMGGLNSEINDQTETVFLESAWFDPVSVRRTSRRLGMHTDASHRFERGADYDMVLKALRRTVKLICDLNPDAVLSEVNDQAPNPPEPIEILYRNARFQKIIGIPVGFNEVCRILKKLGMIFLETNEQAETLKVRVPLYRPDVEHEIDLIEEVARVTGYDRIPVELPEVRPVQSELYKLFTKQQLIMDRIREICSAAGIQEAVSLSFESEDLNRRMGFLHDETMRIQNPLDSTQGILRTSLLPGLTSALIRNVRQLNKDLGLFEIGHVYRQGSKEKPVEELKLGFLMAGKFRKASFDRTASDCDYLDGKGVIEEVLNSFDLPAWTVKKFKASYLHKGRSAELVLNDSSFGILGEMSYSLRQELELDVPVVLAEISLEPLLQAGLRNPLLKQIERIHPVSRDLSVLVPRGMEFVRLKKHILSSPGIEEISLTDRYEGENIGPEVISLTFSLKLKNDPEKPLNDQLITECMADLIHSLEKDFNVKLR